MELSETENAMIRQNGSHSSAEEDRAVTEAPQPGGLMSESLIQIMWHSRWIILACTVAALGGAFGYLQKATPIYTSTSRLYVEQTGPKIIKETEEGVMTQSKNYLYTQAELLRSTPILSHILDNAGIRQMKMFAGMDNPVPYLKGSLRSVVGRKDDIINVSLDSPYPEEAAQVVNSVVDSYLTYLATRKRSTAAEVLKIIQNEKTKQDKELSEKLTAMMDFKKENMALAFESDKGNVMLLRFERLSSAMTEAQLATIESKAIYESTKKMVDDPVLLKQFIEALGGGGRDSAGGGRPGLQARVDELKRRRADRLRQVTEDHPGVAALDTEIAEVEGQIAEMDRQFAQAQVAVAQQDYLVAQEKEAEITSHFELQLQDVLKLNEQLAQYTIFQSDWEQTKKLCDILNDRIKDLNVTEDVGALNISILEVARPAGAPSKPQKARLMGIALVIGLMLGGGLGLVRDWMDQRLRSGEEISALLGVPMLGVVPSISKKTLALRGRMVEKASTSSAAEAYRTIRTAVFFGAPKGHNKTILVTSPGPGDGKTTLVSNLAIAMAQAGQRVLVLDGDFRKPMQHEIFGVGREPGLSSVLSGMDSLEKAIVETGVSGLDILPCGPSISNPSEMLNSEAFGEVLEELSSRYDRVILDSPPVMPVTDACILGAICDITLIVLRAEKSTRRGAQQARDGLLSVDAHILGAVVNDVSPKRGRYGHYYYGYGYHHYGYGHKKKAAREEEAVAPGASNMRTA